MGLLNPLCRKAKKKGKRKKDISTGRSVRAPPGALGVGDIGAGMEGGYQPKTSETRQTYEVMLSFIQASEICRVFHQLMPHGLSLVELGGDLGCSILWLVSPGLIEKMGKMARIMEQSQLNPTIRADGPPNGTQNNNASS